MNNGCVYTAGAGGLDDWAGSLRGLMTDPARFTNTRFGYIQVQQHYI